MTCNGTVDKDSSTFDCSANKPIVIHGCSYDEGETENCKLLYIYNQVIMGIIL